MYDVHNGDSENMSSVGDPTTASPPDEAASAQQHQLEAATVHRDQATDTDREAAG